MSVASIRSGIVWDESTGTYAVALGGEVRGHTLGSPSAPGTRKRPHVDHTEPSEGAAEVESPRSSEGASIARHWSNVAAHKAGRVDPPETMGQARLWDNVHGWYLRAGLCARCASQIAWGHQIGWSRVHPPCETCRSIISTFPLEQVNGWRSVPKQDRTAQEWRIKAPSQHGGDPRTPGCSEGVESTARATVPDGSAPVPVAA